MNLYPNDLGAWVSRQVQVDRNQVASAARAGANSLAGWALGTFVMSALLYGLSSFVLAFISGILTVVLGSVYGFTLVKALDTGNITRHQLTRYELLSLKAHAKDALIQNYLDLALSVVNLPATKDETANREVRDAMIALGIALEALPPEQPVVTDDPAALRAEAEAQIENAQAEPDAVIAASRRRRAESLLRRADTSARTLLLLRRNKALREEVSEQIQALGTSLTALQVGGRQSTPELSGLAASIHRVALEANAVTVARAEVDTLLSQPGRGIEIEPSEREEVNFSR